LLLLTKLDDSSILVNIDSIKYIEANPDTRVQFLNGDSLIIKEPLEIVEQNMIKLKAGIINQSKKMDVISGSPLSGGS